MQPWDQTKPGVLRLPTGRLVRGRGLRNDVDGDVAPEFGLYLMGTPTERVEVACHGGHGRTGTALACLAILDGVRPAEAVRYVRQHYHPRAIETPWQRRYVRQFQP